MVQLFIAGFLFCCSFFLRRQLHASATRGRQQRDGREHTLPVTPGGRPVAAGRRKHRLLLRAVAGRRRQGAPRPRLGRVESEVTARADLRRPAVASRAHRQVQQIHRANRRRHIPDADVGSWQICRPQHLQCVSGR